MKIRTVPDCSSYPFLAFFLYLYSASPVQAQIFQDPREYLRSALPAIAPGAILDERVPVVNVDSAVSLGKRFRDPFGTLSQCYLFAAWDSTRGEIVGVLDSAGRISLSAPFVDVSDEVSTNTFVATGDLNQDGDVDIVIILGSRLMGSPAEAYRMWLFSYHSPVIRCITKTDPEGKSTLYGEGLGGAFRIVDLNGDGIFEILAARGEKGEGGVFSYKWQNVYTWGNGLFGDWGESANLDNVKFTRADNLDVRLVSAVERSDGELLHYSYNCRVHSGQPPALFYMPELCDSVVMISPPRWGATKLKSLSLVLYQRNLESEQPPVGDSDLRFLMSSMGLPTIRFSYLQAYHEALLIDENSWEADQASDISENSLKIPVVVPSCLLLTLSNEELLDTLSSLVEECYSLGWIDTLRLKDWYWSAIYGVKARVMGGDLVQARFELSRILTQVDIDTPRHLSTEAYSILRYDTEYLLQRLPTSSPLALTAISPEMTLTSSGSFVLVVKGTGFVPGTEVLWQGIPRQTTYISPKKVRARVLSADIAFPVEATVSVRNPDGTRSSQTTFSVVTALPAPIRPVLECVTHAGGGAYAAWFGYKNENTKSVYIPAGPLNRFTPAPRDRGQPTLFEPGRAVRAFSVDFPGTTLVWTLNGRTSTASRTSARCR